MCGYSRYLLSQPAAVCRALQTELRLRRAEQRVYVPIARVDQRPDVGQVPERALLLAGHTC